MKLCTVPLVRPSHGKSWNFELILHDAGYTKGISYSSAPLLHKETKDKKARNIVSKNDLSIMA